MTPESTELGMDVVADTAIPANATMMIGITINSLFVIFIGIHSIANSSILNQSTLQL